MTDDSSTAAQDLRALCRQAGQRAAAWQPAQAAQPERSPRGAWLKQALLAVAGALALGVLAAQLHADAPTTAAAHRTAASQPQPPAAPGLTDAAAPVRWVGDELAIELEAVPLQRAAHWLAEATHTTLAGAETLPPASVTLRFRGRDTAAAWRQLLQGHATVALACDASACRAWIGAAAAAPAPAAVALQPQAPARPEAAPAVLAPGETESQPDGSC